MGGTQRVLYLEACTLISRQGHAFRVLKTLFQWTLKCVNGEMFDVLSSFARLLGHTSEYTCGLCVTYDFWMES